MVEAAAVILALVLVPLSGGSFRRLARLHFDSPWLLFGGLGIQVALELVTLPRARMDDVGFALLLASYVLILAFGLVNLRIVGMSIVTIGIACNVLVIALNQGMPYRAAAGTALETTVKHRPERPEDVLTILSDRIVVPDPIGESLSFGDLILIVGILDVVWRGSRRTRREPRVRDGHGDLEAISTPAHTTTTPERPARPVVDLAAFETGAIAPREPARRPEPVGIDQHERRRAAVATRRR